MHMNATHGLRNKRVIVLRMLCATSILAMVLSLKEACNREDSSCWTFHGHCESFDAISVPTDCRSIAFGGTVVITAFVQVRADRTPEQWLNWIEEYAKIPAHVFAWLPKEEPHITNLFRRRREQYASKFDTCVVQIAATQLPYNYAVKLVREKFAHGLQLPPGWNSDSPEIRIPGYVPLQFSKIPFMHAASTLLDASTYIWTDIGLARHVEHFGTLQWPSPVGIESLRHDSIYLSSWDGYGDAGNAWDTFCDTLPDSFSDNRNLLSGTVLIATSSTLERILPIWTYILESMLKRDAPWNNEQPVLSLIGCFYPDLIRVIDSRNIQQLWDTLGSNRQIEYTQSTVAKDLKLLQRFSQWNTNVPD